MPAPRILRLLLAASIALPAGYPRMTLAQAPAAETHAKGDITGDFQGTIQAGKALRCILRVTKGDKGLTAKFYSIDQTPQPIPVDSISLEGTTVKFAIPLAGATYSGTLSPDGNTITGTWSQGGNPLPFVLVRATPSTAWEIPAPPAPVKPMAADADPAFDVATIKPNDSGAPMMQGLVIQGRTFATRNSSLVDLISFAYEVQKKQIINAPDWADHDRFDITATPDTEGVPNVVQVRTMLKKLINDRFKLKDHMDKREMSAFVLTVAKGGDKLKPTASTGPLPGLGFVPGKGGLSMIAQNATLQNVCNTLQSFVFDRPVVDQTGLTGHYDLSFTFTPDDSQFNGHPPIPPAKPDATEVAPNIFEAIQQTLGLKLEAQKTAVPVIAIDHVEKYSAN